MSIISRRQKELLLNDVARMINNNNHTAFANHAKISESVGNGDLKLFIDAPKKEFVIRYGKKEIRFNCNDQNIKELNEIVFNNKSKITGISDTTTTPSSTVSLSTKGAKQLKDSIADKADKQHNHDDKYAFKEHTHDNIPEHNHDSQYATKEELLEHNHNLQYADKLHLHPEYQPVGDYQPAGNYAKSTHDHDTKYSALGHTHYGIDDKDKLKEFINDVAGDKWYDYLWEGLGIAADGYNAGIIWHMRSQIAAIFAILAANGLTDTAQTATGLGSCLDGYASKLGEVAESFEDIGKRFESIQEPVKKISNAIKKGSEEVGRYSRLVEKLDKCDGLKDMTEAVKRFHNGADFPLDKLSKASDVLDMNLLP